MEILPPGMPEAALFYAVFFGVSFGLLAVIASAGVPGVFRGLRKHVRLALARRRRKGRMLADLVKLDEDARRLEGVYRFESNGEAVCRFAAEPGQAVVESAIESDAA